MPPRTSRTFRTLARVGYVVLGVVHIIIGAIAVSVAIGSGGGEADQSGAMQQISRVAFGTVVLWLIVLGLAALGIWQVVEAFLERDPDAKKKWGRRIKEVGTALAYFAIARHGARLRPRRQRPTRSQSTQSLSAQLLATPGGIVLLVLLGLGVLGIGVAFVVRGIRRDFEEQLSLPGGKVADGIRTLGVVGYVAKGFAIGVVGILFVVAAVTPTTLRKPAGSTPREEPRRPAVRRHPLRRCQASAATTSRDRHLRALAASPRSHSSTTPSATPRPAITIFGTPISSASPNFTPGDTFGRSS